MKNREKIMKKFLKNRKGVTLLEGLIALGLLALVAAGTFGVLLSTAHKASKPDIREEMALAVENANDLLHAYSQGMVSGYDLVQQAPNSSLCASDNTHTTPLDVGTHDIKCLLPVICDPDTSSFTYEIGFGNLNFGNTNGGNASYLISANYEENATASLQSTATFHITCNGFTL